MVRQDGFKYGLFQDVYESTAPAMTSFCRTRGGGQMGGELAHQTETYGSLVQPALKWTLQKLGPLARLYG